MGFEIRILPESIRYKISLPSLSSAQSVAPLGDKDRSPLAPRMGHKPERSTISFGNKTSNGTTAERKLNRNISWR